MITTSYEAFYGMDCLREAANLTTDEMAALMGLNPSYYRYLKANVRRRGSGSLNAKIDIKVRSFIAYLIYGFKHSEHLPLMASHPQKADQIKAWYEDAVSHIHFADWDPMMAYAIGSNSTLDEMISIAERFAPRQ